jgi:hypothetical protein
METDNDMENDMENTHALTVTDREATTHARVHADVWEKTLLDWMPAQFDAAMRKHVKEVAALNGKKSGTTHRKIV